MLELSNRNIKTVTTEFHVFKTLCRDMKVININPNQISRIKKTPDGINDRKKDQHTEAMKIETNKNEIHRTKEIKQKVKKKKVHQ